jgi:hypothetical protein
MSHESCCRAHFDRTGTTVPADVIALRSGIELCADCFAGKPINPSEEKGDVLGLNAFRAKKRDVSGVNAADLELDKLGKRDVIRVRYANARDCRSWQQRLRYQAKQRGWVLSIENNFTARSLTVRICGGERKEA